MEAQMRVNMAIKDTANDLDELHNSKVNIMLIALLRDTVEIEARLTVVAFLRKGCPLRTRFWAMTIWSASTSRAVCGNLALDSISLHFSSRTLSLLPVALHLNCYIKHRA